MKTAILFLIILITIFTNGLFAQQPGDLDSTFDGDGLVMTDINSISGYANSVTIQPDGKIILAGWVDGKILTAGSAVGINWDFALARYNADGTLDSSFNADGKLTTDFNAGENFAHSAVLQPDGKIVVAGNANDSIEGFALARYNINGTLDSSFSNDGKLTNNAFRIGFGNSVAIQSDWKIVVVGSSYNGTAFDFALGRFNSNGTPDSSFGTNGIIITDIGTADFTNSVALQPDGKIVAAGSTSGNAGDFALTRYLADGSLDNTFGTNGKLTTDFILGDDAANSIAIQLDGKIVVAGLAYNGSDYDFAIARYISGLNVGILDFSPAENVLIYPNPASQCATLDYSSISENITSLSITNMLGAQIAYYRSLPPERLQLQTSTTPEGIYVIELRTETKVIQKKMVVQ